MKSLARAGFRWIIAAAGIAPLASCGSDGPAPPSQAVIDAMTITALPRAPTQVAAIGTTSLGIASPRDGFLYVPTNYDPARQWPMAVMLHPPDTNATYWDSVKEFADLHGVVLLAIDSRFTTWDIIASDGYGPDVVFLNSALPFAYDRVNVDPLRISLVGFSDGASEALGVGIANAGIFRRVIAFSPGLLLTPFSRGFPAIFISHGNADQIRSYLYTRDFVVPNLRSTGFAVEFIQFEGGHVIPGDVMERAFLLMSIQAT